MTWAGGYGWRRTGRRGVPVLIALAATLLTGCQTPGSNPGNEAIPGAAEAVQHPMLPGVPLPRNLRVVDERSVAWVAGSGSPRLARYEFIGNQSREYVYNFYIKLMPTAGFRLQQRGDDAGVYTLRYQSATEECTVQIGARGDKTYIVVKLVPAAGATASGGSGAVVPPSP